MYLRVVGLLMDYGRRLGGGAINSSFCDPRNVKCILHSWRDFLAFFFCNKNRMAAFVNPRHFVWTTQKIACSVPYRKFGWTLWTLGVR